MRLTWTLRPITYLLHLSQQREIIALDRQGTQQQRPESPTVTPPGVRVNTSSYKLHQRYILEKGCPKWHNIPSISGTLGDTGVYRHTTEPIFIRDRTLSLELETCSIWVICVKKGQSTLALKHFYFIISLRLLLLVTWFDPIKSALWE